MRQLNKMQAWYFKVNDVSVVLETEEVLVKNAIVLQSYESAVAIYDKDKSFMYMLPRWDYSVSTMRQIRTFITSVLHAHVYDIKALRKDKVFISSDTMYILARGYKKPISGDIFPNHMYTH